MEYKKETHDISSMFKEETLALPNDEELKSNTIINMFRNEHGKSMTEHGREYTKLLREYIENSRKSSRQKKIFKDVFFWVSIATLVLSFALFVFISIGFSCEGIDKTDASSLTGVVSSLVGVLSLYIIIPKIIAEYLFNVKEDENMAKIVESIQNYDERVFSSMNVHVLGEKSKKEVAAYAMKDLKKEAEENQSKLPDVAKKNIGADGKDEDSQGENNPGESGVQ